MLLDGCWTGQPEGQQNGVNTTESKKVVAARRPDGGRSIETTTASNDPSRSTAKLTPQRFLATVEADKLRGTYVDPRAGKITLNEYAETFMAAQVWRAGTRAQARTHIANHIGPALGNRQLATITRTDVQAFVASLTAKGLAPTTVQGIHVRLVSILRSRRA